jgi:hypothetical protein
VSVRAVLVPCATVCTTLVVLLPGATAAHASSGAPGWTIQSVAVPSNFSASDNEACEHFACNRYMVTVINTGTQPSAGPVVVHDSLPPGVESVPSLFEPAEDIETEQHLECTNTPSSVRCQDDNSVRPGDALKIPIDVVVNDPNKITVENHAEVEGGGAVSAATSKPTTMPNTLNGEAPQFGLQDFGLRVYDANGSPDTQAGDHPGSLTTTIDYSTVFQSPGPEGVAVQDPKTTIVDLPIGLAGDPRAAEQCPESALFNTPSPTTDCPVDSQVGTALIRSNGSRKEELVKIYNIVPEDGYPATFGFKVIETGIFMRARVVPSPSGYILSIAVPDIGRSGSIRITGVTLIFFGDPAQRDAERGGSSTAAALLTNPSECSAGPSTATLEVDSWVDPASWATNQTTVYEASPAQAIGGCNLLQFNPSIEVQPEETQSDTPTGYQIALKVPQNPNIEQDLATPDLKNAEVTLPEGVSVSAGAADGVVGCPEAGPEGINMTHDWTPSGAQPLDPADPEAMEIGPDGLPHVARGKCPEASKIGTLEITTPLLSEKLEGQVYLAQPECEPCSEADAREGRMLGLYLEAEGSGVVIKLKGDVTVDPTTGRLTAHFDENPQLPFSELKMRLKGGARAPLANPQTCGEAQTTSVLTPWSAPESGPPATPFSSFTVNGCAGDPFNPSFLAQSEAPIAGGYTPFTVQFSRDDGEQDLGGITLTTPPGLSGAVANVPLCGEPQAQLGTCSPASQIGTATVAAGAGSHPYWLTGPVYLTGSYNGAPFGLSVVVPEKAGPFDLGVEVVRAAIRVDPHTAAITVATDPLPQIKDGVPFRLKTISVTINRPDFMFNPTNCQAMRINATISGEHPIGSNEPPRTAHVSSPFAVAGCKNLPFKPLFTVSTQAKTSKPNGAALRVKLAFSQGGEANVAKTDVQLPDQLPSRLTTLQKACTEAQFDANPAGCPAESDVGTAVARTPILPVLLQGPAYLVSHGGKAFPELIIVLQGYGVTVELNGETLIKNGITSSKFETVPDVPLSNFELNLPEGPHSILSANGNLCAPTKNVTVKKKVTVRSDGHVKHVVRSVTEQLAETLVMPTTIAGQNGAIVKQNTKIEVSGCKPAITVATHTVKGKMATIAVKVPSAGKLVASGKGLSKASKTAGAAGTVTVKVTLSSQEQAFLARHRGRQLAAHVKLLFTPTHGTKLSTSVTVLIP